MTMSTQTLTEGARLLELATLLDTVQIYDVGEPVTVGMNVERQLTPVGSPVAGLVQATNLANAAESRTVNTYAVKVALSTPLRAGQAVEVMNTRTDFDLVGKIVYIDKVSENGAAMIRKGTGSDWTQVQQQGKGAMTE